MEDQKKLSLKKLEEFLEGSIVFGKFSLSRKFFFGTIICLFIALTLALVASGKLEDLSTRLVREDKKGGVQSDDMKFTDPGNDRVGLEIKKMDEIVNQAHPSELNEGELDK